MTQAQHDSGSKSRYETLKQHPMTAHGALTSRRAAWNTLLDADIGDCQQKVSLDLLSHLIP